MSASPRLVPLAAALTLTLAAGTAASDDPPAPPPPTPQPADEPSSPAPDVEPRPSSRPPPTIELSAGRVYSSSSGDVRTNLGDWAVGPPGWDMGGELRLLTSDQGVGGGAPLKLSDVGLLRAKVRVTASRRIEASGAVDLLAKQPSYTDELVVQGATFGVKVAVSRKWALATSVAGGPTLDDSGFWGSGGTALVYRSHPDETLSFQVSAGASATALSLDGDGDDPWLTEASAGGMIMIHSPNGWFGMWLGGGLNVPVVHADAIEPATRLDLTVGTVYAVVPDWDIYLEAGIFDRGDAGHPATQLPILDGGFDQRTIMVGVSRRFAGKSRDRDRSGDALLLLGS